MIVKKEVHTTEDAEGNVNVDTLETTIKKDSEPDYIKLYTKTWCEFNNIPVSYRPLFLELVQRMSYCNSSDLSNSQLIYTGKPFSDQIMESLRWKKNMYQKGLKVLADSGAIKRVSRGVYQVNPTYAGKGGWKYNPQLKQGGIKDLIAEFDFVKGTCKTRIVFADDGEDTEKNEDWRKGLKVKASNEAMLKTMSFTPALTPDEEEMFNSSAHSGGNNQSTKKGA